MEPLKIEEEGDVCPPEIRSPRLPRHPPLLAGKEKPGRPFGSRVGGTRRLPWSSIDIYRSDLKSHVSFFQRDSFYFFSSNPSRSVNFITTADHFGTILPRSQGIFGSDKVRLVCDRRVSDNPDVGRTGAYTRNNFAEYILMRSHTARRFNHRSLGHGVIARTPKEIIKTVRSSAH
ncbi:hypothetical protein ALC62_02973 [Cyphomyrmex costatus]|uniref:Uncharacterized protein n=1 Tax=Cyphomyrmex costatus TaxID=456900 RepID=A0A151IME9_9HYME|nr:hypothetical protein ALC62_02973 [Cyphomyrmex costatus]